MLFDRPVQLQGFVCVCEAWLYWRLDSVEPKPKIAHAISAYHLVPVGINVSSSQH